MPQDLLIGDIFRNAARAVPDRVAVALGDRTLTFGEIDRAANRIARSLSVTAGDRVVVRSGTNLAVVPLFAALAKLGAVFVPVSPLLTDAEVEEIIAVAQPTLVVREGDIVDTGDDGDVSSPVSECDPHVIFFTSGSTGRPKGVVLSHRANFLRSHPGAQLEPRGAMVCPYPLFHMAAWTIALQQWQARDSVVFVDSTDAATICAAVARHRATRINAVPALWRRILESPGADLSSLRFADTGTSATPIELLEAIERLLPSACVRVFYGSTEAGNVSSLEQGDIHRKPGSVGVPSPSTSVRIAQDGELLVRGPLLFDGYFGEPDQFVDGWFPTGDLADVDDEGYLSIVGRARDVIRTGGETVAPYEVEAVLAHHPAVVDVAVVGLPDTTWGEVVCAVVVGSVTLDELRAHCDGVLASFKHPRRLEVVDEIPRTASTGQVQRRLLVEQLSPR
ncbi:MAG: fatty-acyl-CoA synthase [Acidimicrobiaceae bacterium]|jgi:acyl-CoA synthetase (AMP-forming)/AMP-acid ligase II